MVALYRSTYGALRFDWTDSPPFKCIVVIRSILRCILLPRLVQRSSLVPCRPRWRIPVPRPMHVLQSLTLFPFWLLVQEAGYVFPCCTYIYGVSFSELFSCHRQSFLSHPNLRPVLSVLPSFCTSFSSCLWQCITILRSSVKFLSLPSFFELDVLA
jgi:hypothetical protein